MSRRIEIMKIRTEINENKRTIQKINEIKTWFFERINNIDKPLATLTKRKRKNIQINKIRGKKVDIITEIKRTIMEYCKNILQ
jgi:hemerythrin